MPISSYQDFVLYVEISTKPENDQPDLDGKGRPNAFSVRVFDSPTGEGEKGEIIRDIDWEQLEMWRNQLAARTIAQDDLRAFANCLGNMIMPPYAHSLYRSSRSALKKDDRLRIRLRLPSELAIWPWEFAIVQLSEGEPVIFDYLAMNERVSVVRHVEIAVPAEPFEASDKRRVLVAMASPKPHSRYRELRLDEEQRQIKNALQHVTGVEAVFIPDYDRKRHSDGATEEQIRQALCNPTDLFHFSGHGEFITEQGPLLQTAQGKGAIILAGPDGSGVIVSAERLCSLLVAGHVRAVVLDACETAMGDVFQKWSSLATSLLKSGIPAVVAMQFTVYDDLGKAFATAFYQALVAGNCVDEAVSQGRLAMWRRSERERDWGAPVLYLRNSGGCILPPVRDEAVRVQAATASEQNSTLNAALIEWTRQGAPASPAQLHFLMNAADTMQLTIPDLLLLLRSALACMEETHPWANRLRQTGAEWITTLDTSEAAAQNKVSGETNKIEYLGYGERLLGLGDPAISLRPAVTGAVTWSAVRHSDALTRQTAAIGLLALGVDEALERLQKALVSGIEQISQRRKRRAELCGTLAETDVETANAIGRQLDNVQDRFAVWRWRANRMFKRNWPQIRSLSMRGALGAAMALATYRAILAIFLDRMRPSTEFALFSYWGFILGLALTFGFLMASPMLLEDVIRPKPQNQQQVAMLAVACGAIAFGAADVLVSVLNVGGLFADILLRFPAATLVGTGLALGLYGQPWVGYHLGFWGWLRRLAPAFVLPALTQLPTLYRAARSDFGEWLGSSIFISSNMIGDRSSWLPVINTLLTNLEPSILSMIDAGLVSVVITLGITFALHYSRSAVSKG